METLALIVTAVTTTAGATWLLRSKLGDIERALALHIVEETQQVDDLDRRVVKLERRKR